MIRALTLLAAGALVGESVSHAVAWRFAAVMLVVNGAVELYEWAAAR